MTDSPNPKSCHTCRLFESLPDSEASAGVCHFPSYQSPVNTRVRIDPFFASIGCHHHMPKHPRRRFKLFAATLAADPE